MRNILIGILVIGTCGTVYSSPIPDNSTPSSQTVSSSTEKSVSEAHSTTAAKKGEKEIAPTTQSTTAKLPEHPKSFTEDHSEKGLGATVTTASKNEASTSQSHKEEPTKTPPSNKPEIKDPTPFNKQEVKETTNTSSGHKMESTNPAAGQKEPTTIKPVDGDKGKKTNNNQKPTKNSTAYLDKGKVVIFNGICGPDGCEIEGDIYDELVPLPHAKKQG